MIINGSMCMSSSIMNEWIDVKSKDWPSLKSHTHTHTHNFLLFSHHPASPGNFHLYSKYIKLHARIEMKGLLFDGSDIKSQLCWLCWNDVISLIIAINHKILYCHYSCHLGTSSSIHIFFMNLNIWAMEIETIT